MILLNNKFQDYNHSKNRDIVETKKLNYNKKQSLHIKNKEINKDNKNF